tara:strand:+ start:688 stop:1323 length:636 start_codon:yes stop_codon:yes gene_type:complete
MGELCTEQLWHQSIAAGKAEELVDMLMECEEGKAALKKAIPLPVDCIIINRVNSEGSFTAKLRRNDQTEFLFKLLAQYNPNLEAQPRHPLGGFNIDWSCEDEMHDWIEEMVEAMSTFQARCFFKQTIEYDIPKKDEDGERIEDVKFWLENEVEYDWHEEVDEKVRGILMDTQYPTADEKSLVYNANELSKFGESGIVVRSLAVFTIVEETF